MQITLRYWLRKKTVLEDMIDRLIEIGKCHGMEMNVERIR
jgi:hypothetical protein